MFLIDWKFTLISLAFAPLCIIPTRRVAKKIKDLARRDFATNVGQGSITMESFQNVRITKAYALEEVHAQAFRKNGRALRLLHHEEHPEPRDAQPHRPDPLRHGHQRRPPLRLLDPLLLRHPRLVFIVALWLF